MRSYWTWLIVLLGIWMAALLDIGLQRIQPYQWLGCALFLGLFFVAPLARTRPVLLTLLLSAAGGAAAMVFWPWTGEMADGGIYALLCYGFLYGKAALRLPAPHMVAVGGLLLILTLLPNWTGTLAVPVAYVVLLAAMAGLISWSYRVMREDLSHSQELQEALLSEYRRLKRHGVEGEEAVREQERTRIARDLHDSMGHKLTALSMQLEVLRMRNPDSELAGQLAQLKTLSQESLAETRAAVSALHQEERGGLRAILELIRRLEAESFVRISFTLGEGVLSARLGNEAAVAVFRSVQEALTNAMRHGSSRQIEVSFEVPGDTVLRFEVANQYASEQDGYREGFGLRAMRERIEGLGGQLQILQGTGQFELRGIIPLGEEHER
ncbi:sensor histidine kinase [Paenibacillus daejeonensis]|uniref:sensor histidine kinase n=1 Tax=Paenibacillus daejeonensis TaxID=135193 RepID=UPI000379A036|nr:sensor histidine kinase [Paenibacillus daejeonensis]